MNDLDALHAQAKRLIMALREGLERLEATEVSRHHASQPCQGFDTLGQNCKWPLWLSRCLCYPCRVYAAAGQPLLKFLEQHYIP